MGSPNDPGPQTVDVEGEEEVAGARAVETDDVGVLGRRGTSGGREPEGSLPGLGRRVVSRPRPPSPTQAPDDLRTGPEARPGSRPPSRLVALTAPVRREDVPGPDAVVDGVGVGDAEGPTLEVPDEGVQDDT